MLPRVFKHLPVHQPDSKVRLQDLYRLDRCGGEHLKIMRIEVADADMPRLALPLGELKGPPHVGRLRLGTASMMEEQQVGVVYLKLRELRVNVLHC